MFKQTRIVNNTVKKWKKNHEMENRLKQNKNDLNRNIEIIIGKHTNGVIHVAITRGLTFLQKRKI